ncbi:uncharacterized protein LOC111251381 isoform X2 [Varroa destructor]|uniref:Uncharacterized protein n=1 Tax=Varroa destructor TaxID=109461 RepID=A0A7M7MHP0_VARDE|nr:uncharacterized protein LOC111251381 isoform X2 [Varroa destructor]
MDLRTGQKLNKPRNFVHLNIVERYGLDSWESWWTMILLGSTTMYMTASIRVNGFIFIRLFRDFLLTREEASWPFAVRSFFVQVAESRRVYKGQALKLLNLRKDVVAEQAKFLRIYPLRKKDVPIIAPIVEQWFSHMVIPSTRVLTVVSSLLFCAGSLDTDKRSGGIFYLQLHKSSVVLFDKRATGLSTTISSLYMPAVYPIWNAWQSSPIEHSVSAYNCHWFGHKKHEFIGGYIRHKDTSLACAFPSAGSFIGCKKKTS